jgi:phosphoribosyl 1,2-cyclic phosphodiesterase
MEKAGSAQIVLKLRKKLTRRLVFTHFNKIQQFHSSAVALAAMVADSYPSIGWLMFSTVGS